MSGRRATLPVHAGRLRIGGEGEIVVQSMTTTTPSELEASLAQISALAAAGCPLVRLAVPSRAEAEALGRLRAAMREAGLDLPLVADIHFSPDIALEAALHVEKVRINPGNFAGDPALARARLEPLLARLRERNAALRIGVNHGSLPPFLADRLGHGADAMVEAALLYLRMCREMGFDQVVVSLKASNPVTMIAANRLLAARLEREGFATPIHLGVTEAGAGAEGRLRSAIGIGALLLDGIGDTVRVSLAGDPADEIPVARAILRAVRSANEPLGDALLEPPPSGASRGAPRVELAMDEPRPDPAPDARVPPAPEALLLRGLSALNDPASDLQDRARRACVASGVPWDERVELRLEERGLPDAARADRVIAWQRAGIAGISWIVPREWVRAARAGKGDPLGPGARSMLAACLARLAAPPIPLRLRWHFELEGDAAGPSELARALTELSLEAGLPAPDIEWSGRPLRAAGLAFARTRARLGPRAAAQALLPHLPDDEMEAAVVAGSLLVDGVADGIVASECASSPRERLAFADELLQVSRRRLTHAEFIACPGCGRMRFDLPAALERLRARFGQVAGVKIAVMGCVVNGPGEMADADFGYVGAGAGRVDLYEGRRAVRRGLTPQEAEAALAEMIERFTSAARPAR